MFPVTDFPAVHSAVCEGLERQQHTGVQIFVSVNGTPVLDSAIGDAAPGRRMTATTRMPWRSAGKPLTAFLVMQQIDLHWLELSTPLSELLPEFSDTDKASVTVFDLLTHQSGFPETETGWPLCDWPESLRKIMTTPRQLEIGTAAYHPQSSWFVLGEMLRRRASTGDTNEFAAILQCRLLNPLAMHHTTCGSALEASTGPTDELPVMYERDKGRLVESVYGRVPWITQSSPGASLRGPVRELGRFYEMILRGGQSDSGERLVSIETIQQMTSRHRVGEFDQKLQHTVDFGLGLLCNSNLYGVDSVPYGFGMHCSTSAFGHGGVQCSMGFCDPERQLVAAWSTNGFCGEGMHQRRNRIINNAIYADLGFI